MSVAKLQSRLPRYLKYDHNRAIPSCFPFVYLLSFQSIFLENNLRLQSDLKSDRQGGRPGLVVMGDDSCLKGCCKIVIVV